MQPSKSKSQQVLEFLYRYAIEKGTSEVIEAVVPYGKIGIILWEVGYNIYEIISNASEEDRLVILSEIQQANPKAIDLLSTELSNDPSVIYPVELSEDERKAIAKGIYQTLRQIPSSKANPQQILQSINQGLFGGKNILSIQNLNISHTPSVGSAVVKTLVNSREIGIGLGQRQNVQSISQYPIINGFEIKGILGEGAYAKVYLAKEHLEHGKWRTCALKVGILESEERFKREVENMQIVDHPHILNCWHTGRFQENGIDKYWISMPNMGGLTLEDLILGKSLDLETKLLILMQITDGLDALHQKKIVHRDLKPSNCLISRDFELKISDFGLSKDLNRNIDSSQSRNADAIGTPAYMSPENIDGKISYYSDVWAFGIIAFEVFSGNLPWGREIKPLVLIANILHKDINVRKLLDPFNLPTKLVDIVERCLKRNASYRYRDGSELKKAFYHIAKEERNRLRHNKFKESWHFLIEKKLIESFVMHQVENGISEFRLEAFLNMPDLASLPLALDMEKLEEVLDKLSKISQEIQLDEVLKQLLSEKKLRENQQITRIVEDKIEVLKDRLKGEIVEELKDFDEMIADRKRIEEEKIKREKEEQEALEKEMIKKEASMKKRNLIMIGGIFLLASGSGFYLWHNNQLKKAEIILSNQNKIEEAKQGEQEAIKEQNRLAQVAIEKQNQLAQEKIKEQNRLAQVAIEKQKQLDQDLISKVCETNLQICEVYKKSEIILVEMNGGSFIMGNQDGNHDEKPIHHVIVRDFYISKTEVTVKQYRKCVDAGICSEPKNKDNNQYCNWGYIDRDHHPINCVDWNQARTFAKWLGGDLPSEAQWEYASRSAGKEITYPWGNIEPTCEYTIMSDQGHGCGHNRTWEVCSKLNGNTEQQLCDMSGNVWEWVLDEWHGSYQEAPNHDIGWCIDLECESNIYIDRVYRGGSWDRKSLELRSTYRFHDSKNHYDNRLGFRISYQINKNPNSTL